MNNPQFQNQDSSSNQTFEGATFDSINNTTLEEAGQSFEASQNPASHASNSSFQMFNQQNRSAIFT